MQQRVAENAKVQQQLKEREAQFAKLQKKKAEMLRLKEAHLSEQRTKMEATMALQLREAEERQQRLREDLESKDSQEQHMRREIERVQRERRTLEQEATRKHEEHAAMHAEEVDALKRMLAETEKRNDALQARVGELTQCTETLETDKLRLEGAVKEHKGQRSSAEQIRKRKSAKNAELQKHNKELRRKLSEANEEKAALEKAHGALESQVKNQRNEMERIAAAQKAREEQQKQQHQCLPPALKVTGITASAATVMIKSHDDEKECTAHKIEYVECADGGALEDEEKAEWKVEVENHGSNASEHVLSALHKGRNYVVRAASKNSVGWGPYSERIWFRAEDVEIHETGIAEARFKNCLKT
jgi:chromosome segregation ATPase